APEKPAEQTENKSEAVAAKPAQPPADAAAAGAAAAPAEPPVQTAPHGQAARTPPVPMPDKNADTRRLPYASPSVRKFARELGVDLYQVHGTGEKQRITHNDVRTYVKQALSGQGAGQAQHGGADGAALGLLPWPKVDFAKFGPT